MNTSSAWVGFQCLKAVALPRAAEDESEPDDEDTSGGDDKEPRDSGCFESSECLEGRRGEASEEQANREEAEKRGETQTEQLDALQEQLQELEVDEGS